MQVLSRYNPGWLCVEIWTEAQHMPGVQSLSYVQVVLIVLIIELAVLFVDAT